METFLHSVSSVAVILLLTALGYLCSALGTLNAHAKRFISAYLSNVAVPIMSVYGLCSNITRAELLRSGAVLLVPTAASTLLFLLSYIPAKLLKLPRKRFGVFMMMCALSNMMFIGYPICVELFGEASVPYVMLNYFVNICFIQFVGRTLVRWSGGHDDHSAKEAVKNVLTAPPVVGLLLGIALILLDVRLPAILNSAMGYVNDTVTPLSLLLTGRVIHEIGLRRLRPDRDLVTVMLFRFLLAPASVLALCAVLGIAGLPRSVLAVEFAMPAMAMAVAYSTEYGADEQFAASSVALSTLACFVVIPVLMLLL